MNELLTLEQEFSVVPKDFKNSNKGKISQILGTSFLLDMASSPENFEAKSVVEFYSQTKHGTLYFTSPIVKIDGNKLLVLKPRKHRFLQRRTFSRVKFIQELELSNGEKTYNARSKDISAGGMKITMNEAINIDLKYNLNISLPGGDTLKTTFEPVKVEKAENGLYTVAGRFLDVSKKDKMRIIQYCLRKNTEYNKGNNE